MLSHSTSAGHGLAHAALLYGSDEQLLEIAVPFLRAGLDEGQPTVLSLEPAERRLILDELGEASGLTELPAWSSTAAFATLRSNHELISDRARNGASHIRILGEIPYRHDPATWGGWIRYETAINQLFGDLAVSMLCPYDRRLMRTSTLDDVTRAHQFLGPNGSGQRNPRFVQPTELLADLAVRDIDPIEDQPPALELRDQPSVVSRRAIAALAETADFDKSTIETLALAIGELVTNAIVWGRPPVVVRAWAPPERIVVTVQDHGSGLADPFVGMLPVASALTGGRGLHIVYQLCSLVTMSRGPSAFTVHMTMHQPST